jgi:hygromycin-B 7''-O-kinase
LTAEEEGGEVADALRRELSLGVGVQRFSVGSVPVFAVGDEHVVKLFPRAQSSYFETEKATLAHLDGRLPIPTPRIVAAGERGSWSYIVMSRLPGSSLAEAWGAIDRPGRLRLMGEVGQGLAELHASAAEGFAPQAVDWPRFMDEQRSGCRDRQIAQGLGAPWVDGIDEFLARWTPGGESARALLHTEVKREHLLVERRDGVWHVSGLVDFEDAMVGASEYEWVAGGIFLAGGEPGLLRALLDAYGAGVDDELPLRLMAYTLLRRYSNLPWYLKRLPVPDHVRDFESLARRWFAA